MKKVEIMKQAIKDAANNENMNGWKWEAKRDGLHWEYLETVFHMTIETKTEDIGTCTHCVSFEDKQTGERVYVLVVSDSEKWLCDSYHDFVTSIEDAIYWAARKMIKKANYIY